MFSRKVAALSLMLALGSAPAAAQGFGLGTLDVGPTIGLGGISGADFAFGGRIEKGIKALPDLGDGLLGIAGFVNYYNFDCGVFDCGSIIFFGATANYHFKITNTKWDPFVGIGLGYNMWSEPEGVFDAGYGGIELAANAGVRYYFSDKLAGYADVATGAAALNVGVMFKLR
jgi:hypothetical protein